MAFANAQAAVAALAGRTASLADLREIVTRFPELRPVVAAYPLTDPSLLDWLGSLGEPLVDAQLAKRAATPAAPAAAVPIDEPHASDTAPEQAAPIPVIQPGPDADPIFRTDSAAVEASPPPMEATLVQPRNQDYPAATTRPQPPSQGYPTPQQFAAGPGYPAQPAASVGYGYPGAGSTPAFSATAAPAPEPGRRRIFPVLLIILLALVLVGGGVGAAFATGLLGGAPAGAAADTPSASAPAPSSQPASASASVTAAATPSAAPSTSITPDPQVTCWDGSTVATVGECPTPSGKDADWAYLKYVYPSIATHSDCTQVSSTGNGTYKQITVMWECELGDALIRYRYWESTADADRHYNAKFTKKSTLASYPVLIGGTAVDGWIKTDKNTADGPGGVKRVVLTMWLPDQQLSMSVEGNTKATMWAAFDLVRIRPQAQALGHPEGTEADEAALTAAGR
jgi:hypothetical protein